jgi:hypothetical protein
LRSRTALVAAVSIAVVFAFVVASFFIPEDDGYSAPERMSQVPVNVSTVMCWVLFLTSLSFSVVLFVAQRLFGAL